MDGIYKNGKIEITKGKLYRSWNDRMLGGVCSGISEKTGIDVSLIRVVFIILLLMGGIGFPIYFVLWIITPLKRDEF